MSQKLIRTINPEVKIISAEEGIVDYIASNETTDSYSEIVSAKGWRFTRFKKNAPFVDSHNYWSIEKLLGKVESFAVVGKSLVERVRWAKNVEENTLAKLGWKMTEGGFLKAVSVGFIPTRWVRNGGEGWNDALKSIGLKPEEGEAIRFIYLEQEQIELSACIIGANPDALAKSYNEGFVKDDDLASVGFADEDMAFLKAAGSALERPDVDPLTRSLVAREIGRITGRSKHSQEKQHDENTNPPGKRAGGEEEERRAFERKQFLRSLADIT
jgi:hypothetical protein